MAYRLEFWTDSPACDSFDVINIVSNFLRRTRFVQDEQLYDVMRLLLTSYCI